MPVDTEKLSAEMDDTGDDIKQLLKACNEQETAIQELYDALERERQRLKAEDNAA